MTGGRSYGIVLTSANILMGLFGLIFPAVGLPIFIGTTTASIMTFYRITNRRRVEKHLIEKYYPTLPIELVDNVKIINKIRIDTLENLHKKESLIINKKILPEENYAHSLWVPKDDD